MQQQQQHMMHLMGMQGFSGMWPPAYNMMHQMQSVPIMAQSSMSLQPESYSRHTKSFEASSDPPDITATTIYPTITNFISALALRFPDRHLEGVMTSFHMQDYFDIDEVLVFSKEDLMGNLFGMSGGNATFLLIQVDDEMRHLERASGTRRRRA
jgi:hypothetical protein